MRVMLLQKIAIYFILAGVPFRIRPWKGRPPRMYGVELRSISAFAVAELAGLHAAPL